MKNISTKKLAILGFLFISIIGTLSHFIYGWSDNNSIVGAFFAVNESVWEHLKIAIIPAFVWMIIEYFIKDEKHNFFVAKLFSFSTIMLSIVLIYYGHTAIFQKESLVFDIFTFYIAIGLGQYVSYKIMNTDKSFEKSEDLSKVLLILLLLSFIVFTYFPPKLPIFKDQKRKGYGIIDSKSTEKIVNMNRYKYL